MLRRAAIALGGLAGLACAVDRRTPAPAQDATPSVAEQAAFSPAFYRHGRWIQIIEDSTQGVWIDSVTLERTDPLRPSGWLMWTYKNPMTWPRGLGAWTATKQTIDVNCQRRTLRLGENNLYNDTSYVGHYPGDDSARVVVPESMGEGIVDALCIGVADDPLARIRRARRESEESLAERADRLLRERRQRASPLADYSADGRVRQP